MGSNCSEKIMLTMVFRHRPIKFMNAASLAKGDSNAQRFSLVEISLSRS